MLVPVCACLLRLYIYFVGVSWDGEKVVQDEVGERIFSYSFLNKGTSLYSMPI